MIGVLHTARINAKDEVLSKLSRLYESEGAVSEPINAKLASLVGKMVKTSFF